MSVAECTLSWVPRVARSRPPRFGWAHRCVAVLVDLDHEAARVGAAREAPQAFRAAKDDCVGVGPGLDPEAFGELLVKEGIEPVLPRARRVDVARHLIAVLTSQTTQGRGARSMLLCLSTR